jgi:A/G-specific adenine glycosylase
VPVTPSVPPDAQDAILAWYAANGRQLAFRRTSDPYAVLVSEAMAQQTQAARAADHWTRFIARFPTVAALAAASPADVLRQWHGLGYDRRAIALWRAARVLAAEHGGLVPDDIDALQALPGIGPYTARAVAAIAFGRSVGAVDVNVRRVLGRMLSSPTDPLPAKRMQFVADASVPLGESAAWTHALMDVGATLCRPRSPRCADCPARSWCRYARTGTTGMAAEGGIRRPTQPFPSTNRWLRGRILDRLREARGTSWVTLDTSIGSHDIVRVHAAARALAGEGLIEVGTTNDAALRARLKTI